MVNIHQRVAERIGDLPYVGDLVTDVAAILAEEYGPIIEAANKSTAVEGVTAEWRCWCETCEECRSALSSLSGSVR